MKIAQKLTLCLVAVTGALFLVGGYRMVAQNFNAALESAAVQNAAQHTAQKLSVQDAALRHAAENGAPEFALHAAGLEVAAAMPQAQFALLSDGWASLYSRLPDGVDKASLVGAAQAGEGQYTLCSAGQSTYMLLGSSLPVGEAGGRLVSVFDISPLYAERTAQLHRFWRLCAVLLCAAAALTLGFTTFLLRPLKRLSAAAARIAAAHQTALECESEVGRGTTVRLPLQRGAAP